MGSFPISWRTSPISKNGIASKHTELALDEHRRFFHSACDGQRFLMLKPNEAQGAAPTQINVVLNWFEELNRRVPAGTK